MNPFSSDVNPLVAWPEGVRNLGALNLASPLSTFVTWLGTAILGGVATQFLLGFVGVVLTGFFGGRCVYRFGGSAPIAIASAVPLCVSAPMIHWWSGVPTYTHAWLYIALFDFGIRHLIAPNIRDTQKFAAATLIATAWSPYVAVFSLIITATLLVLSNAHQRNLRSIKDSLLITGPALLLLAFYLMIRVKSPDQIPARTLEEASTYALSLDVLWEPMSAFYVGRVVLAVAALSCVYFVVLRHKQGGMLELAMFVLVLIVFTFGVLFIRSSTFPTLWNLVPQTVPQIRQGRYAGQVIQVALVLIGALGLSRLSSRRSVLVVVGICLLFLAGREGNRRAAEDLNRWMARATYHSVSLRVLRNLPDGVVAHFPWDLSAEIGINSDPTPCLAQRVHKKPIINLCDYTIPFTPLLVTAHGLSPCEQLEHLKKSGVDYIIVSVAYAQPILRECLGKRNTPHFTGKLAEDQFAELWRLS